MAQEHQLWGLGDAGSNPVGCAIPDRHSSRFADRPGSDFVRRPAQLAGTARQTGKEVRRLKQAQDDRITAISKSMSEVSNTLAQISSELADHAISTGLDSADAPLDVPTAISRGAPLTIPPGGVQAAMVLSDSAAPVARSAPVATTAFGAFAPAMS